MTRYTIRKLNPITRAWFIYFQTCDISDAYDTHSRLINMGFSASITQEYVSDGDE